MIIWFKPNDLHTWLLGHTENAGLMLGQRRRRWPNIKTSICWITGVYLLCINRDGSNIADKPNTVLMLGHRLRRWPNIKPALHRHLLFAWHPAPSFVGFFVVTQKLWIAVARHNFKWVKITIILWNSMTLTSFVFTELANTIKYGGVLYNLVITEWRHCMSQNEVWGGDVI